MARCNPIFGRARLSTLTARSGLIESASNSRFATYSRSGHEDRSDSSVSGAGTSAIWRAHCPKSSDLEATRLNGSFRPRDSLDSPFDDSLLFSMDFRLCWRAGLVPRYGLLALCCSVLPVFEP